MSITTRSYVGCWPTRRLTTFGVGLTCRVTFTGDVSHVLRAELGEANTKPTKSTVNKVTALFNVFFMLDPSFATSGPPLVGRPMRVDGSRTRADSRRLTERRPFRC